MFCAYTYINTEAEFSVRISYYSYMRISHSSEHLEHSTSTVTFLDNVQIENNFPLGKDNCYDVIMYCPDGEGNKR